MKVSDFFKVIVLLLAFAGTSCSRNSGELEYLAVKYEGEKLWSIIDKDGKDICRDEISGTPSRIVNDIFTVRNSDGEYEYYNIKDIKKPVTNESYTQAGLFFEDVTFAVKRNGRICIIDRDCKVVKELPDNIKNTYMFSEGLSVFKDDKDKYGYLNSKGEIVIKATYDMAEAFSDGIAVVTRQSGSEPIRSAIDKKGNELFKFKSGYQNIGGFSEGLIIASYMVNNDDKFVMLNKKGEREAELKRDGMTWFSYEDGICIFRNKDRLYGLMNPDGEIVVNAKYERLVNIIPDRYAALKNDKAGVINKKGETVLDFDYELVSVYCMGKDKFIVKDGKQLYIVDEKGKAVNKDAFEDVTDGESSVYFENDYLDVNAIAKHVVSNIAGSGAKGIEKGITAAALAKKLNLTDASAYKYSSMFNIRDSIMSDVTGTLNYIFNRTVTDPVKETVMEKYFFGSYPVEKIVGYKFSDSAGLTSFSESFYIGNYPGRTTMVADALKAELVNAGFKADTNDNNRLVSGKGYCIISDNGNINNVSGEYYFDNNSATENEVD